MADDWLIRDARPADLQGIARLYESSGLDEVGSTDIEILRVNLKRLMAWPGARVLVAAGSDGTLLGTLTLFTLPLLAHGGAPAALVEDVAVHPAAQGRGLGRALVAQALRLARAAGCYKLALSSNARRQGAHAFYERLGFQRHGVSFVIDLEGGAA
ncbi:GNAT family N-acetyltransferase [Azohydromonas caseinilytica]|uniref:GNAT family N-acetyltransferase n=1 Tax=Azohydromonas caseinilytica TaxID=2728836 RepID=A0A848FED8_9BURK|nr:GNAT family N-acetyltransferase [Azohydromonas caseinilytica]NML17784.1 GNAT family N-acetyltransferase [Azohydromonas caseinilytica]